MGIGRLIQDQKEKIKQSQQKSNVNNTGQYIGVEEFIQVNYTEAIKKKDKFPFENTTVRKPLTPEEKKAFAKKMTTDVQFAINGYESNKVDYIDSKNNKYVYSEEKTTFFKEGKHPHNKIPVSQRFKQKINHMYNMFKNLVFWNYLWSENEMQRMRFEPTFCIV